MKHGDRRERACGQRLTLDVKRGRLYVGTGNNYSEPATATSDAIVAWT